MGLLEQKAQGWDVKELLYFIPLLILATVIYKIITRMAEEANRCLPVAEQFRIVKRGRSYDIQRGLPWLRRKHQELYPGSKLAELTAAVYSLLFGIWMLFLR
jgi:hypothetical protein